MKKTLIAAILGFATSTAFAADAGSMYAKVQLSRVDVSLDVKGTNITNDPRTISFAFGKTFNDYFAVEGMVGTSYNTDKIKNTNASGKVKYLVGASAVGYLPLSDVFRFYAKVGLAKLQYKDSDGYKADLSGVTYGGGIEVNFSDSLGVDIGYLEYPKGKYDRYNVDLVAGATSVGVFYRF